MRRARAELEGEHTRHLLLLGEPKYLERQEASLRQQLDSARKMGALAGSLDTRQAELRLELSEARPRYGAAVAKVKKLQADLASEKQLHLQEVEERNEIIAKLKEDLVRERARARVWADAHERALLADAAAFRGGA